MRRRDNHQFDLSEEDRRLRVRRVDSLLAQIIQERLARGIADPRFRGLVSITGVEVSPDLREATVRFSVLPAQYGARVLSALKSARGLLKREIQNESSLKRVPELTFRLDTTLKHDAALADAIRSGTDDDKNEEDRERPDAIDS
jgi:ribosome-binding factor A